MKSIKKGLRLLSLVFIIGLATVLPVPITFYRKDNLPKFKTEQLDEKKVDDHKEDMKVIS